MAIKTLGAALGYLNRLFVEGTVTGLSDDQLLDRFLATRDGAAFEALMARHGPMVLRVCRAVLRSPSDAEDAFQATFLVLVKKARALRGRANLGGWLYLVAYRVAIQSNAAVARRRVQERRASEMSDMTPSHDPVITDELLPTLHEEIARLPERLRLAVVLCDLQGVPQAQAAETLRWSMRTLQRRLAEGRERLKARLGGRGMGCSGAVLAAVRLRDAETVIPPAWRESTLRAALDLLNSTVGAGAVSAAAQSLTHEVLKTMFVQKLTVASAALMGACLTVWAVSAALITQGDEPPKAATAPIPQQVVPASPIDAQTDPLDAVGTFPVRGRVLDPDGRAAAGAEMFIRHNVYYGWTPISPVPEGQKGRVAVSDAGGRFGFELDKASSDLPAGDEPWWHKAVIAATAPGFGLAWVEAGSLIDGRAATLRLVRDDVPIRGRVLDTQGRPVAGVTVRLGRVVSLKDGAGLDAMIVSGRLDNEQIAASYGYDDATWPGGRNTWTSAADGRFEVRGVGRDRLGLLSFHGPGLADGRVYAMARPGPARGPSGPRAERAPGDAMANEDGLRRAGGGSPRVVGATFEFVAGPTKPIAGIVRLKGSGRPLAGVAVHGSEPVTGMQVSTRTDAAGRFRLVGLPKGDTYQVWAYPRAGVDPFLPRRITVGDTEGLRPIETTLELPRGVIVIGRLVDEATGRPVFAREAQYFKAPSNRNEGGDSSTYGGMVSGRITPTDLAFRMTVPPGEGAICATARGRESSYAPARLSKADEGKVDTRLGEWLPQLYNAYKAVDVPDAAEPFAVELKVTRGLARKGRVLDPDGRPMAGARCSGLAVAGDVTTLAGDTFEVLGLEPDIPRELIFDHKDRSLVGSVIVRGGGPGDGTPIEVHLGPPGSVKGRLVDDEGRPLSDVRLQLVSPTLLPEVATSAADADGRFLIVGLIPGIESGVAVGKKPRPGYRLDNGGILEHIRLKRPGEVRDLGDVTIKEVPREE